MKEICYFRVPNYLLQALIQFIINNSTIKSCRYEKYNLDNGFWV